MRRILLVIFVSILGTVTVCAQDADSLHIKSSSISVDSLIVRLNTLQHNYDFLYCDYELHKVSTELSEFSNTTNISSNSILINYYNSGFDRDLYSTYLGLYNAKTENLKALKEKIGITTLSILDKMLSSNFTEKEIAVIENRFKLIESQMSTAEKALNYFEVVLDIYRKAK